MKLQPKAEWLRIRAPDIAIERTDSPNVLQLDEVVDWVKKHKPILWVGSIFSVPKPTGFPSGYAVTRSLFDLIFPYDGKRPEFMHDRFISELMKRWPLEAIFDQFELLQFDLSESLLEYFAALNQKVSPNALHYAVTLYYERGLANAPLCVTTNWDTLIEKAFRSKGYSVHIGGPSEMPRDGFFGKESIKENEVSVYHPHGSFETKDVVCSSMQEQKHLSLHMSISSHPTLFLGYSGYEPSLYRELENSSLQLWCVRNESDLKIPAKRRLLCRPNTYVFVGDMLELLRALDVLTETVSLKTNHIKPEVAVPPKVINVVRSAIVSTIEPKVCSDLLVEILGLFHPEPEATFRFSGIISAINNHIRNRQPHAELPLGLMASARFRNDEQLWISLLAYILRFAESIRPEIVDMILANAEQARKEYEAKGLSDIAEYHHALVKVRTRVYRSYIGRPERKDDDAKEYMLNHYSPFSLGDMAQGGELCEIAAFACLRDGEHDRARGYFDTAATYYYVMGLWNAGSLNEWASNNVEKLEKYAKNNSLKIPADFKS